MENLLGSLVAIVYDILRRLSPSDKLAASILDKNAKEGEDYIVTDNGRIWTWHSTANQNNKRKHGVSFIEFKSFEIKSIRDSGLISNGLKSAF